MCINWRTGDYKWCVSGEEFSWIHYIFISFPFLFTKCPVFSPTHLALCLHDWNEYFQFRRSYLYILKDNKVLSITHLFPLNCIFLSDLQLMLVLYNDRTFYDDYSKIRFWKCWRVSPSRLSVLQMKKCVCWGGVRGASTHCSRWLHPRSHP